MKKFVNLYRLLRLGVPPQDIPAFCGTRDGPHQAAALLLAILVSDPGHARDLFTRLLDTGLGSDTDIVEALEPSDDAPAAQRRLVTTVTCLRLAGVPVHGRTATYHQWARTVARFSFETYHLYAEPTARCHSRERTDRLPTP